MPIDEWNPICFLILNGTTRVSPPSPTFCWCDSQSVATQKKISPQHLW